MSKRQIALSVLSLALLAAGCTNEPWIAYPAAGEEALTSALRAKTDLARGLRWELRWGNVAVYEVATERLVRRIELPGAILANAASSCTPDMLMTRSGAVWVSSNAQPVLWRISPERFEVERFEVAVEDPRQRDIGFSGLALTADERHLYGASAATGTLWQIDLAAAKALPVELSSPLFGACGLKLEARTATLSATIGSAKGAQRVHLSEGGLRGEVRTARTTELASAR